MIMRLSAPRLLLGAALMAGTLAAQQASVTPLFQLNNVQGGCEVKRPDATAFEAAVNRRAYPFGTVVRTGPTGEAVVEFSSASYDAPLTSIALKNGSEAVVDRDAAALTNHIVRLVAGETHVFADLETPERALTVETPDYAAFGFAGRAVIQVSPATTNLITTRIGVVKGGLKISGNQFSVERMRGGCALLIETAADRSLTRIIGETGETVLTLENGTEEPLQFAAYPRSIIKIWREFAPVGGRLVVAVFAVGPDGKHPECYAFAVGQPGMVSTDTDLVVADEAAEPVDGATPAAVAEPQPEEKPAEDVDAAFKELFGDSF